MTNVLIVLGVISIIVFVWSTIMIYSFLRARNEKIESFLFINIFIFRYISDYRTLTKKETGKVGYLFYLYIFSINIALICFVALMAYKYF
jgi:hypothetical protein